MTNFKLGCQTYTWEMLGRGWHGTPDDLLDAVAAGGYQGIEITDNMIGHYADDPKGFAAALNRTGLNLAAFTVSSPSGFTESEMIDSDVAMVRKSARFTAAFPGALLVMGSATIMSPGPREAKYDVAATVYDKCFAAAADEGVTLAVHPSSHTDTLIYDATDYTAIFERMDARIGWVPDTGHILRGGQTINDAMTRWADRIIYVHLKDVDSTGKWAMLGAGVVDAVQVADLAAQAPRFNGWLVVEEESEQAGLDPSAAVKQNHATLMAALGAN